MLHVPAFILLVIFAKDVVYTVLPIPICMPVESQYKLIGGCFTVTFASVLSTCPSPALCLRALMLPHHSHYGYHGLYRVQQA
jgi:hypothetical protein